MAKIGGGLKSLFKTANVSRIVNQFKDKIEKQTLKSLQFIGDEFVTKAKLNDTYKDRTANLRSSIGYIILNDGKVIDESFSGEPKGKKKGKEAASEFSLRYPKGYVLIGVAGMEYAFYVESKHGLDVISGSAPTKEILKSILSEIKF